MSQLFPLNNPASPPPRQNSSDGRKSYVEIPILGVLKEGYLLWHSFLVQLPRLTRHTLGERVDNLFTEILEITLTAQYTKREDKKKFLEELSAKLDNLKFFVTLLWEAKGLNAGKYGQISQKLNVAGRMLGKWLQSCPS